MSVLKPMELKHKFIELRAQDISLRQCARELGVAKSTCERWEKNFQREIGQMKQEQLKSLYEEFAMTKKDRIKRLGSSLAAIKDALADKDLREMDAEKLLNLELKYHAALKEEYTSTELVDAGDLTAEGITAALADLLNRIRSGEVSTEQAQKESMVLSNMLRAFELSDVKKKIEELELIVENSRR